MVMGLQGNRYERPKNGDFLKFLRAITEAQDLVESTKSPQSIRQDLKQTILGIRTALSRATSEGNFRFPFKKWVKSLQPILDRVSKEEIDEETGNELKNILHAIRQELDESSNSN